MPTEGKLEIKPFRTQDSLRFAYLQTTVRNTHPDTVKTTHNDPCRLPPETQHLMHLSKHKLFMIHTHPEAVKPRTTTLSSFPRKIHNSFTSQNKNCSQYIRTSFDALKTTRNERPCHHPFRKPILHSVPLVQKVPPLQNLLFCPRLRSYFSVGHLV